MKSDNVQTEAGDFQVKLPNNSNSNEKLHECGEELTPQVSELLRGMLSEGRLS